MADITNLEVWVGRGGTPRLIYTRKANKAQVRRIRVETNNHSGGKKNSGSRSGAVKERTTKCDRKCRLGTQNHEPGSKMR